MNGSKEVVVAGPSTSRGRLKRKRNDEFNLRDLTPDQKLRLQVDAYACSKCDVQIPDVEDFLVHVRQHKDQNFNIDMTGLDSTEIDSDLLEDLMGDLPEDFATIDIGLLSTLSADDIDNDEMDSFESIPDNVPVLPDITENDNKPIRPRILSSGVKKKLGRPKKIKVEASYDRFEPTPDDVKSILRRRVRICLTRCDEEVSAKMTSAKNQSISRTEKLRKPVRRTKCYLITSESEVESDVEATEPSPIKINPFFSEDKKSPLKADSGHTNGNSRKLRISGCDVYEDTLTTRLVSHNGAKLPQVKEISIRLERIKAETIVIDSDDSDAKENRYSVPKPFTNGFVSNSKKGECERQRTNSNYKRQRSSSQEDDGDDDRAIKRQKKVSVSNGLSPTSSALRLNPFFYENGHAAAEGETKSSSGKIQFVCKPNLVQVTGSQCEVKQSRVLLTGFHCGVCDFKATLEMLIEKHKRDNHGCDGLAQV